MATPRKHWLRLYESIMDETWDDATLAAVVRLMCFLNRRWARNGVAHEDAGKATVPMQELCSLMRRTRQPAAMAMLRRVQGAVSLRFKVVPGGCEIDWPKFSILQEYGPRHSPGDRVVTARSLPSPTPTPTPTPREEEDPPTPVATAPGALAEKASDPIRQIHSDPSRAQVRLIWPEVQKAAEQYGKRWQTLTPDRLTKLAARLRDHGPDPQVLVRAVHGAVAYWRKTMPEKDPIQYIATDTIYGASKFSKYLEFATDPKTAPRKRVSEMSPEEIRELQRRGGINV